MHREGKRVGGAWAIVLALVVLVAIAPAAAQTATATLRGTVTGDSGPLPGATIVAKNTGTGFQHSTISGDGGSYSLTVPPGTYDVSIKMETFRPLDRQLEVGVGQVLTINFKMAADNVLVEEMTVVGKRVVETKTSEVATNVTPEQIDLLPQGTRNFVNFAALAPGVSVSQGIGVGDPRYGGATFRSGGQDARQVNVFIDGLSYKNDVIKGGAFMQDSSQGNPFPQMAIQEFRIITSNYKAEYERAAAAIITAVTKSGTNSFMGDAFVYYVNDSMVSKTDFQKEAPQYKRLQYGLSGGGPFVKDKLFWFGTYEQNDIDRFNTVGFGGSLATAPGSVQDVFAAEPTGDVKSPFGSKLALGKVSWQPAIGHTVEFTGNWRDESDERDFGNQRAFSAGVNQEVKTLAGNARYLWAGSKIINEAQIAYSRQEWIQGAVNMDSPQLDYFGIGTIGGRSTIQNIKQDRYTLRDDLTYTLFGAGRHALKAGVAVNFAKYDYDNAQDVNPVFRFRSEDDWLFPFEASIGFGDPDVNFDNQQYGLYIQDDWAVTPKLEVNIGLRYEYETNMLNNDWNTPADVRAALDRAVGTDGDGTQVQLWETLDRSKYITDGRDAFTGALQPRLGFSYDIFGDSRTVLFGAWGRYYDHVNLQDIYEEQHKYTWRSYRLCFTSPDAGAPPSCPDPIEWDPSYQSRDGLLQLIESGVAPGPEVWMLNNDTEPPTTDQWSLGVRQAWKDYQFSLSYNNVRGKNGLIWWPAVTPDASNADPGRWGKLIRDPEGDFGTILYSTTDRETWYDGIFFTAERPYSASTKWGFRVAYTYQKAKQLGNEDKSEGIGFGFDWFQPQFLRQVRGNNDERHRIVASGTFGLPWEIRLSALLTLGSGVPYTIFDFSNEAASIRWNEADPPKDSDYFGAWGYESVDLSLEKNFSIGDHNSVGIRLDGFNVTNFKNYCGFENFWLSPTLGTPNCQYGTRTFQVGLKYQFR